MQVKLIPQCLEENSRHTTPEHRLLFAVVTRTILDLRDTRPTIRRGAARWFRLKRRTLPASIGWQDVLDHIDLDENLVKEIMVAVKYVDAETSGGKTRGDPRPDILQRFLRVSYL